MLHIYINNYIYTRLIAKMETSWLKWKQCLHMLTYNKKGFKTELYRLLTVISMSDMFSYNFLVPDPF